MIGAAASLSECAYANVIRTDRTTASIGYHHVKPVLVLTSAGMGTAVYEFLFSEDGSMLGLLPIQLCNGNLAS